MIYISVIIPSYNSKIIDQTIASLMQQDFNQRDYEIIVVGVDDLGLVKENNTIKFINTNQQISPAKARNHGVEISNGQVIAFIDADCVANSNWLTIFATRFSDSSISVIGGGIKFENSNYWTLSDNISMFHEFLIDQPPGEKKYLPSLNLAIKKTVFKGIGGFDERYPKPSGEDIDLCIRLRRNGYKLLFDPRAIILHKPSRNTLTDLVQHGYFQGKYSIKVDPRHKSETDIPNIINSRYALAFLSPLIALGAVTRIFYTKQLHKYWYTLPAIYINKIAWCLGASNHFSRNLDGKN